MSTENNLSLTLRCDEQGKLTLYSDEYLEYEPVKGSIGEFVRNGIHRNVFDTFQSIADLSHTKLELCGIESIKHSITYSIKEHSDLVKLWSIARTSDLYIDLDNPAISRKIGYGEVNYNFLPDGYRNSN